MSVTKAKRCRVHGSDELGNLCLACYQCNAFKGPNIAAADPETGQATFLYNPRTEAWQTHFKIDGDGTLIGLTPQGRVTVDVLRMNLDARIQYRQMLLALDEYPCQPNTSDRDSEKCTHDRAFTLERP